MNTVETLNRFIKAKSELQSLLNDIESNLNFYDEGFNMEPIETYRNARPAIKAALKYLQDSGLCSFNTSIKAMPTWV